MLHHSLWLHTAYPDRSHAPLAQDTDCDVCVVGGGLSGLANAYMLAQAGVDVVLLEMDRLLVGATGNSTGKLTVQHDLVYADLIDRFGVGNARLYLQVNQEALDLARSFAGPEELQTADSILYATTREGSAKLTDEMAAYQSLGLPGILGRENELALDMRATLKLPGEARIHPVRFGQHLAERAVQAGARLHELSGVERMDLKERLVRTAKGHAVRFKQLVLCTHYPIEGLRGLQVLKLTVNRSYVVSVPATTSLQGQYLSVDGPKRSIRTARIDGTTHFMLSGQDHVAGMEQKTGVHYETLARELGAVHQLPAPAHGWSAQDPSTPDLIPYAGVISSGAPHVYISTGYRKWGLSNAIACARIITDQLLGRANKATELFAPDRSGFGALVAQALQTTGLVVKELASGYVLRNDAPICTHMGCRTRWNEGDRTWDCPCHGSRFREDGSVLEGPATKPLDLS